MRIILLAIFFLGLTHIVVSEKIEKHYHYHFYGQPGRKLVRTNPAVRHFGSKQENNEQGNQNDEKQKKASVTASNEVSANNKEDRAENNSSDKEIRNELKAEKKFKAYKKRNRPEAGVKIKQTNSLKAEDADNNEEASSGKTTCENSCKDQYPWYKLWNFGKRSACLNDCAAAKRLLLNSTSGSSKRCLSACMQLTSNGSRVLCSRNCIEGN